LLLLLGWAEAYEKAAGGKITIAYTGYPGGLTAFWAQMIGWSAGETPQAVPQSGAAYTKSVDEWSFPHASSM
jgi:hypothetical protein